MILRDGKRILPPMNKPDQLRELWRMQDALNNEVAKVMFELAVDWTRRYGSLLYTGNPSNNTSGGGYKEFPGLDNQIATAAVTPRSRAPGLASEPRRTPLGATSYSAGSRSSGPLPASPHCSCARRR